MINCGTDCRIYRNSGSRDNPIWVEIPLAGGTDVVVCAQEDAMLTARARRLSGGDWEITFTFEAEALLHGLAIAEQALGQFLVNPQKAPEPAEPLSLDDLRRMAGDGVSGDMPRHRFDAEGGFREN